MSASRNAVKVTAARPTSSSFINRRRSSTVGTSPERGSIGSDESQGASLADEAQTCYNILLILRTDTQHLISLRNENLAVLEDQSGLNEDAASSRTALLACINESITAATRSITQLGPFLDRHRWPVASRPTTPAAQRRSFTISFKPRRRRSKSTSGLATGPAMTGDSSGSLCSADELFSWTLALTAQHTAVLVATERLCAFLESGIANVSEEERKRRDARASWWQQGRGEFENVGLIQSLLGRPKRTSGEGFPKEKAAVTMDSTLPHAQVIDGNTAENLTPITENDDNRSETLRSEEFTPATITSTPKGLTARPKHQTMGSLQQHHHHHQELGFAERHICIDSMGSSSSGARSSIDPQLSRTETFGAERRRSQLPPSGSSISRPRVVTSPLPSAITMQNIISGHRNATLDHKCDHFIMTGVFSEGDHLSAGSSREYMEPTPPFTPGASPDKQLTCETVLAPHDKREFSSSSPTGAETVYTPYTPVDLHSSGLFTQRALPLPTSRSFQPSKRELDSMIFSSPDQGARSVALRVSPVEAKSRVSIAPMIEGPDNMIVSPIDTDSDTLAQPFLGVSPITTTGTATNDRALPGDVDGHVAWLVYMERKRQISASRWSLRRANTNDV